MCAYVATICYFTIDSIWSFSGYFRCEGVQPMIAAHDYQIYIPVVFAALHDKFCYVVASQLVHEMLLSLLNWSIAGLGWLQCWDKTLLRGTWWLSVQISSWCLNLELIPRMLLLSGTGLEVATQCALQLAYCLWPCNMALTWSSSSSQVSSIKMWHLK